MIPVTINREVTVMVASPHVQEALMDPELAKVIIVAIVAITLLIAPFVWTRSTR